MSDPDFAAIVVECLKGSTNDPAGRLRVHFRVDMGGTSSDVVCRAEKDFLSSMTLKHDGMTMPVFECKPQTM